MKISAIISVAKKKKALQQSVAFKPPFVFFLWKRNDPNGITILNNKAITIVIFKAMIKILLNS